MSYICNKFNPTGPTADLTLRVQRNAKVKQEFSRGLDTIYSMRVPTRKSECQGEEPYWFFCRRGNPVAKIFVTEPVKFDCMPDVDFNLYAKAIQISKVCSSQIQEAYEANREYGDDDEEDN